MTKSKVVDLFLKKDSVKKEDALRKALKGDTGEKGEAGRDGKDGKDGKDGVDGQDGKDGLRGEQGVQGLRGLKGERGEKGDKGEQGKQGVAGMDGINGPSIKSIIEEVIKKIGKRKVVISGGYTQPLFRALTTGTGDYNIKTTDGGIRYTGNVTYTATLPAAGLVKGYEFDIKNASTVSQKVVVTGGQLIDGAAEIIIEAGIVGSYPNLRVKSFGTGYDIV